MCYPLKIKTIIIIIIIIIINSTGRELCCLGRKGPGTVMEGRVVFIWCAKGNWQCSAKVAKTWGQMSQQP